jgi:ribose transport system substrate-binding protein
MKRFLTAAMITAGIFTLSSAVQAAPDNKPLKVGFSNRTLNGAFFNGLTEYMKISAQKAGYEIITTEAAGNMNKQISDVEDMLSQGIDILVLNPQDPAAGVNIAKRAAAKGIPVIDLDSDISLDAPVITRIMANNPVNNKMLGEYAVKLFGDQPINAVIISGNQGNLVGASRRDNFIASVMEEQMRLYGHTNFTVLTQGWGDWDQQGSLKAMEDALVAHGDKINAVYSEMDDMALGAIRALKAAGKLKNVRVFAHDGYKKGLESIKNGELLATASNNPKALSEKVMEVIREYKAGKTRFSDYEYITPVLITQDNIDQYYDKDSIF